ncbi:methylated-DNA--[protein]-cysteine S-methyltransferase [Flavobacterium antarcticum]|uniref:methylated-DNA--[protein]-cysteine S-methyltransferase n=1 Tax=Flavobacterium antarcticum TaxID=271155 RepID=UPI0003B5F2BE|nr:methylated-DNA--[protein]-cysteine S-methyltransferase [Flavobacterium antarcticum]
MHTVYIKTPLGTAEITGDVNGVFSITILNIPKAFSLNIPKCLQLPVRELNEYFNATRTDFTFPLIPQGTEFQKRVWQELRAIPFGKTISYMDLAKKLGDPKVIRAAASANGKNPLWIVIPCHRVIGSDGSLTGYAGGLWRKKWLLEHENPSTQHVLF